MASNRPINPSHQGRPLKPALASNRTAKTPVAPRLAPNATTTTTHLRIGVAPAGTLSRSRAPSLQPSPIEDGATPAKLALPDTITPRSSSRKSRVDSTTTTPLADDTPSHLRPKLMSPTQSESGMYHRNGDDARPRPTLYKTKSANGRDVPGGSSSARSQLVSSSAQNGHPRINKDTSPLFFRADQAKSQPDLHKKPAAKKAPTFFYANGQGEEKQKPHSRRSTPDLPAASDVRSPHLPLPPPSRDHALLSPVSPPLSSTSPSLRSPFFPSSMAHSPSLHPTSPSKENIHLSYRKGVSQIIGRPQQPSTTSRRPSLRLGHAKSQSVSSIDTTSPDSPFPPVQVVKKPPSAQHTVIHAYDSEPSPPVETKRPTSISTPTFPPLEEPLQSPAIHPSDLAAEARRERKVLDLEISNSSLLAINKSLEREIRKQKTELKRYRRLSRAGQFNVAALDSHGAAHLSTLNEEGDALPEFNGSMGRPSSPFLSDPGEDLTDDDGADGDSTTSSGPLLSPSAQADKDAKHRVDDEERLRMDLDRHRELLLDTQRMNKSLQRCLTWTEDLINYGKKALEYQVPSDVKLGGRILTDDDDSLDGETSPQNILEEKERLDLTDEEDGSGHEASVQDGGEAGEEDIMNIDDLVASAMGGYLKVRPEERYSGSGPGSGSEKDSGVDFDNASHTPMRPSNTVEFGKPTPLRNPLLFSRETSSNKQPLQPGGLHRYGMGESF